MRLPCRLPIFSSLLPTYRKLCWHHTEGCSNSSSSKAAGKSKPEAYPLGYVEDFGEPRTKLANCFSILLALCEVGGAHREIRSHLVKRDLHAPLSPPVFQEDLKRPLQWPIAVV